MLACWRPLAHRFVLGQFPCALKATSVLCHLGGAGPGAACLICVACLAFCWTMLSWGMWLGVGNECWIPGNIAPDYGSAFWLAVTASIFAFLGMLGAYAVLAMGKKEGEGGGRPRGFKKGRGNNEPQFGYPADDAPDQNERGEAIIGEYPQESSHGDMAPPNTPDQHRSGG